MSINWICTGKSEHLYKYKNAEGVLDTAQVIALDFIADVNGENLDTVNELYEAKPVLTEAGVSALIGLQVYPQGFTVYGDTRLTNLSATGVIEIGTSTFGVLEMLQKQVGDTFTTAATDGDDEGGDEGGGGVS